MHTSPDTLALAALGEELSPADRAHLAGCPVCQLELESLTRTVELARTVTDADQLEQPPARVWEAIRAEIGLAGTVSAEAPPAAAVEPRSPAPAAVEPRLPAAAARPRRRLASLILAAAIALVAGIGVGIGIDRLTQPARTVVARAELRGVGGSAAGDGTATVYRYGDGTREMIIQVSGRRPATGRREVWLADPALHSMTPIGYIAGDRGRWTIPDGLNLSQFPVIDISDEPADDTDLQHSGTSLLRGQLSP